MSEPYSSEELDALEVAGWERQRAEEEAQQLQRYFEAEVGRIESKLGRPEKKWQQQTISVMVRLLDERSANSAADACAAELEKHAEGIALRANKKFGQLRITREFLHRQRPLSETLRVMLQQHLRDSETRRSV